MKAQSTMATSARTLRPSRHLYNQSRTVIAVLTLPVFAAMLWFAIPRGTWPRVIVALAMVLIVYLAALSLLRRVRIVVNADGIFENGFFIQNRRIAAKRIASVVLVDVYRGQSLETARQLFMVDASGDLLLRMRGQYWSHEAVQSVADAFTVPVRVHPQPLTKPQLRHLYGPLLFWFERWPLAGSLSVVGGIAAFSLLLIWLMSSNALVVAA